VTWSEALDCHTACQLRYCENVTGVRNFAHSRDIEVCSNVWRVEGLRHAALDTANSCSAWPVTLLAGHTPYTVSNSGYGLDDQISIPGRSVESSSACCSVDNGVEAIEPPSGGDVKNHWNCISAQLLFRALQQIMLRGGGDGWGMWHPWKRETN
jgi:hypothetical protein